MPGTDITIHPLETLTVGLFYCADFECNDPQEGSEAWHAVIPPLYEPSPSCPHCNAPMSLFAVVGHLKLKRGKVFV